jgi:hypothetical protein
MNRRGGGQVGGRDLLAGETTSRSMTRSISVYQRVRIV